MPPPYPSGFLTNVQGNSVRKPRIATQGGEGATLHGMGNLILVHKSKKRDSSLSLP